MRPSLTITIPSLLVLVTACSGGGGGSATAPAQDEAWVYTNADDPRLMVVQSAAGDRLEVFGERDELGVPERADLARIVHEDGTRTELEFDESDCLRRVEISSMGGMHLDWATEEIAHIRFTDPEGLVIAETWMDVETGSEVEEPAAGDPGGRLAGAAPTSPGAPPPGQPSDPDSPMTVYVDFRDCAGNVSRQGAAWVEACTVQLDIGPIPLEFPAERISDGIHEGFVARLPRSITEHEWTADHCEAWLAWIDRLCQAMNEQSVSGALLSVCELPSIVVQPHLFAMCVAANLAANLYCLDSALGADLACSGLAHLVDPWAGTWLSNGLLLERPLRAASRIRTCDGGDLRTSETRVVTRDDHSVTLTIDGCVPELEPQWMVYGVADEAGFAWGTWDSDFLVYEDTDPPTQLTNVPSPVTVGPVLTPTWCYWPPTSDPLYEVEIDFTSKFTLEAEPQLARFSPELEIARTATMLRAPTQDEIDGGLVDGGLACLERPESMGARMGALNFVYLKPFRKMVLYVDLDDTMTSADTTTTAKVTLAWPTQEDGTPFELEWTGDGTYHLTVTHDDVRRAQERFFQGILDGLPPDLPLPPYFDAEQGPQCYLVAFVVEFDTTLEVSENRDGWAEPYARYFIELGPE